MHGVSCSGAGMSGAVGRVWNYLPSLMAWSGAGGRVWDYLH